MLEGALLGLDDDIAILAGAPVFGLFAHDALRLLTFAGERRMLAPGELLFRRGDKSDGGYIVMSGEISLMPAARGAKPVLAGRSALIGRNALFAAGQRPADAIAASETDVMRITPTLMGRVLKEFPAAAAAIHAAFSADLLELTEGLGRVRSRLEAQKG